MLFVTKGKILMFNEEEIYATINKKISSLKERVYIKAEDAEIYAYKTKEPLPFDCRTDGEYVKLSVGDSWGEQFDCAWFNLKFRSLEDKEGFSKVLVVDLDGEGLVYEENGVPYRGITNINSDYTRSLGEPGKRIVQLDKLSDAKGFYDIWIDAGNNAFLGDIRPTAFVREAYSAHCDLKARKLYYDLQVLNFAMHAIPSNEPRRYEILDSLRNAVNLLKLYSPYEFDEAEKIAAPIIAQQGCEQGISVTATGHAHLDLAWRWPIRETKRKAARTYATAIDLMERYPEYIFGASQPQAYQWIKDEHPVLYGKISEKISDGRWELQGAAWVECDTNIPGGESLVRQLLYGNKYWKEEFGKTVNYLWMPDVFGYSGALPQILKKSGIDYFSTVKLAYNIHNNFPYTTFHWKGIDGSSVLVHMPPEGNYLSEASPRSLAGLSHNAAEKSSYFGEALLPFGIGDGGGGPSPFHLEYLRRDSNMPGFPQVKMGRIDEFFKKLEKRSDDYPVYEGELYFERHQGTLTTVSNTKKNNKIAERKLHNAELYSALASKLTDFVYPYDELLELWHEVLLYQFHDILPGSSINRVYDETDLAYIEIFEKLDALTNRAIAALSRIVDTSSFENPVIIYNPVSFERTEWVESEGGYMRVKVPAMGYAVAENISESSNNYDSFENDYISAEFSEQGALEGISDKLSGFGIIRETSNLLCVYEDSTDAWDFPYNYRDIQPEVPEFLACKKDFGGTVKTVTVEYRYNKSYFKVTYSLKPDSRRIDVKLIADWHEKGKMLRTAFYPSMYWQNVDCGTQFGYITRSSRNNNRYEMAQNEFCAHNWISVGESNIGFAVLSKCKYGWYAKEGCIEMNLLRGTDFPAHLPDEGYHEIEYAVMPDKISDGHFDVIKNAEAFNNGLIAVKTDRHKGVLPAENSFFSSNSENVLIDGIKRAESSDDIVVRTYEACGGYANGGIKTTLPHTKISECDLSENTLQASLGRYGKFEIKSYIVE